MELQEGAGRNGLWNKWSVLAALHSGIWLGWLGEGGKDKTGSLSGKSQQLSFSSREHSPPA